MFWSYSVPSPPPVVPMFHEYRLTEQGTSLFWQTKQTDSWYQNMYTRMAQEAFKTTVGGVEIRILDHNDKILCLCFTLKQPKLDGPP